MPVRQPLECLRIKLVIGALSSCEITQPSCTPQNMHDHIYTYNYVHNLAKLRHSILVAELSILIFALAFICITPNPDAPF